MRTFSFDKLFRTGLLQEIKKHPTMMASVLICFLGLFLFIAICPHQIASENAEVDVGGGIKQPKKSNSNKKKDWSKLDFNTLEKEWEVGDEDQELMEEYELTRKAHEMKNRENYKTKKGAIKAARKDPFGLNVGTGGTMMFAKLKKPLKRDFLWTNKEVDKIAGKWSQLLRSASMDVKVVNIGAQGNNDVETGTLLLSLNTAWNTYDMMKIILNQEETDKVTLNNKDYFVKDLPNDDDDY